MRNLKRALSLTLASVMLLGMMVVGAGAASYPDVDENNNIEAIEVLQAVKVMVGDDNGNFGPEQPVNRSQMAVVMALLLNLNYDYYEGTCPFWDVPSWAEPYVAACYANGIVSGYSAYEYGAGDPVTAVQAASMMMRALGYFKYASDYADGFELSTVKQASKILLFEGVNTNATDALTRDQVARMALNALQTPIVEAKDNTINISSTSGDANVTVTGGQVDYVVVASNQSYAKAIDRVERSGDGLNQVNGYTVELGEQLYNGKLKLNDDIDPFNRPARAWEYDGKTIGLYAKEELMEYENVGTVTGKDLYDLLGKTIIDDYTIEVALDGVTDPEIVYNVRGYDQDGGKKNVHYVFDKDDINRSNNGSLGATGTGVLTQVFVDPDYNNGANQPEGKVYIAIINTYLARASQDYDSKREELALNVYSVQKSGGEYVKLDKNGASLQVRLGGDEFPVVKNASKDDAFLVTFAEGEVQTAVPAEVMSAVTVSSFKVKDNVVVNGETYKFTTTAGFDADALKAYTGNELVNLKDRTYNIFLDAYGNLIGVQEVDAVKNYVFITALDLNDSNLVNGTANAKAVFLDGTVETIQINMDKSTLDYYGHSVEADDEVKVNAGFNRNSILNTWCTFTKNNSGVYTVKQVVDVNAKGDDYVPNTDADNTDAKNNSGLAQYHQTAGATEFTIDKKHITLSGKSSTTGEFAYVYGNENTVYLTAELTNLTNQGGTWGVIKGVDSVSTGIENTNLNVWTNADAVKEAESNKVSLSGPDKADYASKGVYTLYDDDGIVIAAVVVGEDDGTARNMVYVHSSSVDWEAYNGNSSNSRAAGDDLFTWTRKVISDGQEITLTEVSDGNSDLAAMKQYHWYQIKTNGSGEVSGVYQLPILDKDGKEIDDGSGLDSAKMTRLKDFALDYKPDFVISEEEVDQGEITYTVQNGASTILYYNQNYIVSHLRMNGRTLYVATDDETGFIVGTNVKWVVQQWDNNKKETYIDEGTTATGLKTMIDELNRRNANLNGEIEDYHYQVSAIIEGGVASSVVIYYNENDYERPNTGEKTGNVYIASGETSLLEGVTEKTCTFEVLGSGDNTLKLAFTAPAWANKVNQSAGDLSFDVTLMMDGKAYERHNITSALADADGYIKVTNASGDKPTSFATTQDNLFSALQKAINNRVIDPSEHTFSVVISNITWKNAGVRYFYTGNKAVEDGALSANNTSLAIGSDNDTSFAFTYTKPADATAANGITYSITGMTVKTDDSKTSGDVTSGTAVSLSNVYAGNGWVTVTIGGVTAGQTPETGSYSVESKTDSSKPIEFAVVDAKPADSTKLPADTEWKTSLSKVEDGKIILVRSAKDGAPLDSSAGLQASNVFNVDVFPAAAADGVTVYNDISGDDTVYYFTMPECNVAIKDVTLDEVVIEKLSIAADGETINVKLASGGDYDNNDDMLEAVNAYINSKVSGVTSVIRNGFSGDKVGLNITKNGVTVELGIGDINVGDDLNVITIDETDYVGPASGSSTNLSTMLSFAGVAMNGSDGYTWIKKTVAAGTISAVADNGAGSATIANEDVYDTNSGKGYIKLAATPVTSTVVVTSINSALTGAPTAELKVTGTDGFKDGTNAQYVKPGATLTITIKNSKDESVDSDKDVKAQITVTGGKATVGGTYATATLVADLAHGSTFNQTPGIDLTFNLTAPQAAQIGEISVELTGVAAAS